jgi:hypothetical protein
MSADPRSRTQRRRGTEHRLTHDIRRTARRTVAAAAVHGYTTAFWWAAGIFFLGALPTALLLRSGAQEHDPAAVPALAH